MPVAEPVRSRWARRRKAAGDPPQVDAPPEVETEEAEIAEAEMGSPAEPEVVEPEALVEVVPEPVDYVFLANTFHGVPDQPGLARAVAATLKADGQFGIVNWHRRPREETVVLGQPRGPKTEMRMEPDEVAAIGETAGFLANRTVELPPYHYGIVLERRRE